MSQRNGQKPRILIMEGNEGVRDTLKDTFRIFLGENIDLDMAKTPDEAKLFMEQHHYNLVSVDQHDSDEGVKLIQWMRNHGSTKQTPVIMYAWESQTALRRQLKEKGLEHHGVIGFFKKPDDLPMNFMPGVLNSLGLMPAARVTTSMPAQSQSILDTSVSTAGS